MSKPEYDVGYRKPPLASRFHKGQSGNPKGRAKGSENASTVLQRVANTTVTVTENGCRKTKSKLELAFTQVMNKAAGGDLQAINLFLRMLPMMGEAAEQGTVSPDLAADRDMARQIAARWAARQED